MDHLNAYLAKADKFIDKYPTITQAELLSKGTQATGAPRAVLFLASVVLEGVILFVFGGAKLVINVIGFVYPAWASFKALESDGSDDDTDLLTYWVVYSFFAFFENTAEFIVSWIPFYFIIKVVFLIWCQHPSTRGAKVVYQGAIRPFLLKHGDEVERKLRASITESKVLDITVESASGFLDSTATSELASSFVELTVGAIKKKSTVVTRTSSPTFNTTWKITPSSQDNTVTLAVNISLENGAPQQVASTQFSLNSVGAESSSRTLELRDAQNNPKGSIVVNLKYA